MPLWHGKRRDAADLMLPPLSAFNDAAADYACACLLTAATVGQFSAALPMIVLLCTSICTCLWGVEGWTYSA